MYEWISEAKKYTDRRKSAKINVVAWELQLCCKLTVDDNQELY